MIRLYGSTLINPDDDGIIIASEAIKGGGYNLWDDARNYFRQHISDAAADIRLLPIVNDAWEVICYAYQDGEANRELRMIKELEKHDGALQFRDIFPEIKEAVVCSCNELAYRFVKYLEKQDIPVAVMGEYWDYFGYDGCRYVSMDGEGKMAIYAEGLMSKTSDLFQTVVRSASPEFECIDRIYEENVLDGRIKDSESSTKNVEGSITGAENSGADRLLSKLRGKEVIVLGTDYGAQDAYDFLYGHGIDICCFAEWWAGRDHGKRRCLLGKRVISVEEIINENANISSNGGKDTVFVSSSGKNSALGTSDVEIFDYYGYERNEKFFLLQDYMKVPCTNLLHVLNGNKVFLAGDEPLCRMVAEYLARKNKGGICPEYIELAQVEDIKETDIFCVINPWSNLWGMESNPVIWHFWETLSKKEITFYTDYFAQTRVLVEIDLDRNEGKEKYSMNGLIPKGILLGRIPAKSGNALLKGILDGHTDVLEWRWDSQFNDNLLLYCIRLARERSEDVLSAFEGMYRKEFAFRLEDGIECLDKFIKSAETLFSIQESFTSQELFVIFHIAYAEMSCGYKIRDVDRKIIYWEPHQVSRDDFPFFAQWLEDGRIQGHTVCLHRDSSTRTGSLYNWSYKYYPERVFENYMSTRIESEDIICRNWEEFHARFEDIKLHPQRELRKLCGRLGFAWSDTMLKTTDGGEAFGYAGTFDFDMKPVFNKYEKHFSEFDRLRISIISGPYQKKYGYTYEDCLQFTRSELQEMFLKEFRYQRDLSFEDEKDKKSYFVRMNKDYAAMLWEVRKYMLLNNIEPEFGEMEIGGSVTKQAKRLPKPDKKEWDRLLRYVREQEKLVLYGTGRDCGGLLGHLSEEEQEKLVFSDLKAEYTEKIFRGKKVIAPSSLLEEFKDYKILVTSSAFYKDMQRSLECMGVEKGRIMCNRFQLW